ncbi:HDOD domain-containing protein [Marinomonas sp. IMCC 4694]|uniref:HDOD domain-containing protein n=1 Tax=Marinomonas sp. IMCC 4694 TaxID=2605432 RepID=UPI0011E65983|nr:HDOD domain-containing protein [Marinomonas sp. IMCC 4694]TYL47631.1 HDOD domain-containing protein [Marinomonas sp. IMCC 4694]
MKDKTPSGLNEWLHFLKSKKIPVRGSTLLRLKNEIEAEENTPNEISACIMSDPLLAFSILNEANRVISNKDNDIKSPIHAAAIIGTNGIKRLFPSLAPYRLSATENTPHIVSFLNEIQTSYDAATIAKHWAAEKHTNITEDIFWITLFRDVVRWLLWFYARPAMLTIRLKLKQGNKSNQAEMSALGCRIDELATHLYRQWYTPKKITDALLTNNIPNASELQTLARLAHNPNTLPEFTKNQRLTILINNPMVFSYCANQVAHEAKLMKWDSKNLPFLYRVVATVMHRRTADVSHITHLASIEAARQFSKWGEYSLAQQLIDPELYINTDTSAAPLSPIAALKKALGKHAIFDTKQKANMALKTLLKAIPHAKACIVFKHINNKLSPILQYGYPTEAIKYVKWDAPSAVFSTLSKKRSAAHFSGHAFIKMQQELPPNAIQLLSKNSQLILASTLVTDREMVILWLETQGQFSEQDYTNFKITASLISQIGV